MEKSKKEIDPKYYNDSEKLFNILIGTLDVIWRESFKDTENKFEGENTFDDSMIGTTSLTELHDIEANKQLKKSIEELINHGRSDMERKFFIYPKNSTPEKGLSISCKIEATFNIDEEEFDYDVVIDTHIAEDSNEKYKFLRRRFTERMVIFNTKNIKELHRYSMERSRIHLQELGKGERKIMSKLRIVGGTKYKKKIDPKHYSSAENLLNIVFNSYDLMWLDAIKNTEEKYNGNDTFNGCYIGTTSMNELLDADYEKKRKSQIDRLVEHGFLTKERRYINCPNKRNMKDKGIIIVFEIKFTFKEETGVFTFDSDLKIELGDEADERFHELKKQFLNVIESLQGKDIQTLYDYSTARHKYYLELSQNEKPDA